MKTENEKLKALFSKNLGHRIDIPDFESMWQKAGEGNKKKRPLAWRIAASVALVVTMGTLGILHRRDTGKGGATQITSWSEPTRFLNPSQTDRQLTTLIHWTSPTRFLLPENNHPAK